MFAQKSIYHVYLGVVLLCLHTYMRALCIDHVRTEGGIRVAGLGFWWCAYVYTYPADTVPEALVEGGGGEQHLRQAGDPEDGAVEPQAVSPVGEPVQPLRPPFVRRHAQPRHPRRLVAYLRHLLRHRQPRHQVRRAAGRDRSQNGRPRVGDDGPHENGGPLTAAADACSSNAGTTTIIVATAPPVWRKEAVAMVTGKRCLGGRREWPMGERDQCRRYISIASHWDDATLHIYFYFILFIPGISNAWYTPKFAVQLLHNSDIVWDFPQLVFPFPFVSVITAANQ
jgi:hypothetical protein